MLNSLSENSQCQRLCASDGFFAGAAVGQGSGNLRNLGDPAPVRLLLCLHSEFHLSEDGANGAKTQDMAARAGFSI